ncbi:matrilysin-like [Pyrgilauda ruficollis]|uniref:matrilysin-like n=1 Tax=Pyrgilauda ruficollis TaxID=221976 RepID=UPI001B87FC49|nr:matrilysin-like [Pyrgilauda ruficollis]
MGTMHYLLLCALIFLPETPAFPVQLRQESWISIDLEKVKRYLDTFFPILSKTQNLSIEERIKEMQKFFHLTVTGKLDKETEEIMTKPRCGMPDEGEHQTPPGTRNIYPKSPSTLKSVQERVSATNIAQHIKHIQTLTTVLSKHGDGSPFDGRGKILAHAFLPGKRHSGDAHFDDDEKWSDVNQDVNLFLVAVHEFGHSLGLTHSNDRRSMMYPYYSYQNPKTFMLLEEDKRRIQKLYGKKPSNS